MSSSNNSNTLWGEIGRIEGWGVGQCLDCGLSLKHLPENRCPACGRYFDPTDRSSMDMGDGPRKRSRLLSFFRRETRVPR